MSTRVLTQFDLQIPRDISEALDILDNYQDKITPVAGGSDMLMAWKHGVESGNAMSVAALPGLGYLSYDDNDGLPGDGWRDLYRRSVAPVFLKRTIVKALSC